jgi:hypothetical protein
LAGVGDVNKLVCDRLTRRYFFTGIQAKSLNSRHPAVIYKIKSHGRLAAGFAPKNQPLNR